MQATTARQLTTSAGLNGRPTTDAAPPRLRRRPLMALAWAALVVVGGALGVAVWMGSTNSSEVVAVRTAVDRGAIITATDLMVVRVSVDPAVQVVPASHLSGMVGQRAASDLSAGTLLSPGEVTSAVVPATGQSVVGVALARGKLPATPLRPGDQVRLIQTPADQADVPATQITIDAVVVSVTASEDGQSVVVDVLVPSARAPEVAARAATDRVALVLDSRER